MTDGGLGESVGIDKRLVHMRHEGAIAVSLRSHSARIIESLIGTGDSLREGWGGLALLRLEKLLLYLKRKGIVLAQHFESQDLGLKCFDLLRRQFIAKFALWFLR